MSNNYSKVITEIAFSIQRSKRNKAFSMVEIGKKRIKIELPTTEDREMLRSMIRIALAQ